uniref:BPTI/Kunitz inhibitor domain-containing protein n=1 Tax=Micrurus carvalhoi TaxID=3147026 RepID=A0A2H6MUB4_9SAUR
MKVLHGLLLLLLYLLTLLAELPPSMGLADICIMPKQEGNCKVLSVRWFYNRRSNRCERFMYGGCGGNANNFKNLQECLDKCKPSAKFPAETPRRNLLQGLISKAGLRRFYHRLDEKDVFHDAAEVVECAFGRNKIQV